jgi:hypothetical protein
MSIKCCHTLQENVILLTVDNLTPSHKMHLVYKKIRLKMPSSDKEIHFNLKKEAMAFRVLLRRAGRGVVCGSNFCKALIFPDARTTDMQLKSKTYFNQWSFGTCCFWPISVKRNSNGFPSHQRGSLVSMHHFKIVRQIMETALARVTNKIPNPLLTPRPPQVTL